MRKPIKFSGLIAVPMLAVTIAAPATSAQPEPIAPPEFVALQDVDPTILQDIRYFTAHNFVGDPIAGYQEPICILTRKAAESLKRAQHEFLERGYTLKVYDCYRPQRAVDQFVSWGQDLTDQRMKVEFYRSLDKADVFPDGYVTARSGHSRGSTMDVTLVKLPAAESPSYVPGEPLADCAAPQPERFADNTTDMGTGFDCFNALAHTRDSRIQGEQLMNRLLLNDGLQKQGFINYENEWWHFTLQPETFPDTYFDFPVRSSSLA